MHDPQTPVNWVQAVADADLLACFNRLKRDMEQDTALRNKMPDVQPETEFKVDADSSGPCFAIGRDAFRLRSDRRWARWVRVMLVGDELTIAELDATGAERSWVVKPVIDQTGQIRYLLRDSTEYLSEWQLRQVALQRAFYGLEVPLVNAETNR